MRRIATISASILLLSACGEARSPSPDGGSHGYLLFRPPSQDVGWKLVDQLTEHGTDRELIRTSGLVDSEAGTMFVDFTGTCEAQTRLIAEAKRVAETLAIQGLRCTATAPTG